MSPSRLALVAVLASFGACSSANDRRLRVESWPQGAEVTVGDRVEGQTPLPSLHVVVPEDGFLVLLIEKDGYQTVAYKLDETSPDLIFIPMEIAPDLERIGATIKSLQSSIESLSQSVGAMRADLSRSGSK